jgi:esterase/lipase
MEYLLDQGFDVVSISYRGHLNNPGKADQEGIIQDVQAQIEDVMATKRMDSIYLEGSSLGGAAMMQAMSKIYSEKETAQEFGVLLLKSTPLNLHTRPISGLKDYQLDHDQAKPYLKEVWNQAEAACKIRAKKITIVQGENDSVVPLKHGQQLETLL